MTIALPPASPPELEERIAVNSKFVWIAVGALGAYFVLPRVRGMLGV